MEWQKSDHLTVSGDLNTTIWQRSLPIIDTFGKSTLNNNSRALGQFDELVLTRNYKPLLQEKRYPKVDTILSMPEVIGIYIYICVLFYICSLLCIDNKIMKTLWSIYVQNMWTIA